MEYPLSGRMRRMRDRGIVEIARGLVKLGSCSCVLGSEVLADFSEWFWTFEWLSYWAVISVDMAEVILQLSEVTNRFFHLWPDVLFLWLSVVIESKNNMLTVVFIYT